MRRCTLASAPSPSVFFFLCLFFLFFFFQAEDGIRDRSPSRGLGDVYKRQLVEKENDKKEKSFDGMYAIFDNTKTDDEIETVDQLTERKIDKKTQQEFKDKLRFYIGETDKYRTSSVLAEVLAEGIDYISSLCEAFQNFYTSFENRIEALDRRIAAPVSYTHLTLPTKRIV